MCGLCGWMALSALKNPAHHFVVLLDRASCQHDAAGFEFYLARLLRHPLLVTWRISSCRLEMLD